MSQTDDPLESPREKHPKRTRVTRKSKKLGSSSVMDCVRKVGLRTQS